MVLDLSILTVNGETDIRRLAKNILIPIVGGSLVGMLATREAKEKYRKLDKPSFAPPSWVFPVAWTGLYTAMGLARYRVSLKEEQEILPESAPLYNVQLGLNFLWSFLFFRWGLRGTAFIEMAIMLSLITITSYEYYQRDKTAGALMIPYIGWVTYALGLNYSIWQKN